MKSSICFLLIVHQVPSSQNRVVNATSTKVEGRSFGINGSDSRGLADVLLPLGYPESVSDDYIYYQLWCIPTHITGWMYTVIVTSSLLQVGIMTDKIN